MPKQTINIGVEGNDGTGDSIRDAFGKTNENFSELYAVFGQGGTIRFTALSDTPDDLGSNKIVVSNDTGAELLMKNVVGGPGILIDNTDPDELVITNSGGRINQDLQPQIGGFLDGSGNYTLGNIGPISDQAAVDFNTTHSTAITVHDLVADKKYNDMSYQKKGVANRMRAEPVDASGYTFTVGSFTNGNLIVANHGFDHNVNGTPWKYTNDGTDPINMNSGDTYYVRYVSASQLSIHPSAGDAISNTNKISANGGVSGNPGGTHTITDGDYDNALYGTYLSTEAMPRSATVRRQGDDMEGPLYLHDHPGNLAGSGTPNDVDDLQAATKFYVDNSSFTSVVDLYVRTNGDDTQAFSPVGKEGRSLQFAYKTIGKACEKAEEIIECSPLEPGAYIQTVTYNDGEGESVLNSQNVTSAHTDGIPAKNLLLANKVFIQKEIVAYINATYPNFQYNQATCERDMGYIVDALAIDIENGLNANFQSIQVGKRYFQNVSAQIARTTQLTETLAGINYGKALINIILQNGTVTPVRNTSGISQTIDVAEIVTSTVRNAVLAKIDVSTNIIENGLGVLDTTALVEGSTVTLVISNGGQGYVDQGAPNNVDILPGKIIRGKTTGALGRIVKYTRGANEDTLRVFLIEPKQFALQEKLEFGNFTRTQQICIHVESGTFYEDYPIKLPANVSIKGTDFRRCIMRPKNRGSQSKWINTYFYRDANFDGLDLIPTYNPDAYYLIQANREFIKDETIGYITNQIANATPGSIWENFTYNEAKCERDTGLIIDAVSHDLKYKGNAKTYEAAAKYYVGTQSLINGQEAQTALANTFTRDLIVDTILPQASYTPFQSITTQVTDANYIAESGTTTRITSLMDSLIDVITNGLANLPDLLDPRYGYHYTEDPTKPVNLGVNGIDNPGEFPGAADLLKLNKEFITQELIEYINETYSTFTYDQNKCERDTGLILDAVSLDVALGTNYNTVTAGKAYQRANTAYLQSNQLTYTVGAIQDARDEVLALTDVASDPTAVTRVTVGMNEVVDILQNGLGNADPITYPVPSVLPTTDADDAALHLQANRDFIRQEALAYISVNFPAHSYDSAKCSRDVGYLVDALTHDVLYGGNYATRKVAESYFVGAASQLGAGEGAITVSTYNHLANVMGIIVTGLTVTPTAGNTETQDTSNPAAGAPESNAINTLVQIVEDVITIGNLNSLAAEVLPSVTWATQALQDARSNIIGRRADIITSTIAYVDSQVFSYNEAKCARDTRLIIDGLVADLVNGGRVETLANQTAYYTGAVSGQESQTADAINYIKTIGAAVLSKTPFADSRQSAVPQNTTTSSTAETFAQIHMENLVDCVKFAFDANYNPPKNNQDIDVFMMNDSNRIMNVTMQGHGGFAQVLDPDGQILIKSPYVQVCGTFSKSVNKQAFRGGMYIDAFTANTTMTVTSKDDPFTLNVSSGVGSGLRKRRPETPCPFYIQGVRYQVDAVTNYDQAAGTATLFLNPTSGDGAGFTFADFTDIVLQTAGNTSMLANDYTQVNDLGYGIVVNNGALTEQVSTFTYYCHAAYMANNGSQIRSLNGSNSNGNYGLVAAGSDPNEVIDQITLFQPMVQVARVYDDGVLYLNEEGKNTVYVYDLDFIPTNISELEVDHGGTTGLVRYEVASIQRTDAADVVGASRDGEIFKLNITGNDGLTAALSNNQKVQIRSLQNFIFSDLKQTAVIRPSTAIVFDEQDDYTYRTIAFGSANAVGDALPTPSSQSLITFDSNYDYVRMVIDQANVAGTTYAGTGTTQGATAGDVNIAIESLSEQTEINRLNNGDMIFAWEGKVHRILSYSQKSGFGIINIEDVNSINDAALGDAVVASGIQSTMQNATNAINIRAGLNSGENAGLTVNISVCRATGHDFNDIGSGGFNSSNYPGKIYGAPQEPVQAHEVQERDKGRVFYVSTDQDGFFRVGRFFTVDQGTGRVTFAASIALSNLDGIGFKRGVVITEFSSDDAMTDNAVDSAPTESAVRGYFNRRTHIDETSQLVDNPIGPGFIARDGSTSMTDNLNMATNQITSLGDPGAEFDATNKRYVDGRTPFGNSLMYGTGANGGRNANDIIVWTGTEWDTATPTGYFEFTYNAVDKTVATGIADGSIVNADVNAAAQIAQSKLNMQSATTRSTAVGVTQANLGLAVFDSVVFSSNNGFISIDEGQLPITKLANIPDETVIGRASGDSADGDVSAIPFSTIVNSGGTFTTTGFPDAIVKTDANGAINVQALFVDSNKTIDTSGTTVTFTNPGSTNFLTSQTTGTGTTNNNMIGNLNVGNARPTESNTQANSTYAGEAYVAADWMYSHFIEAPNEADNNSTGIAIGAGTGFSNADQIGFMTAGDQTLVITNGAILPGTTDIYNIGSATKKFNEVWAITTSAQANTALYADLAENYLADAEYEVGSVLIFGGEQEITTTTLKGDTRVAGVVSEKPGYLMNAGAEGDHVTAIALQGRVPVNVVGVVRKGDMLVTASIAGYAVASSDPKVGTVIGKALQAKDDPGRGTVEAVVGRV